MDANNGADAQQNGGQTEKAGCVGVGFSFVFPLVGIIMFFSQKGKVESTAPYGIAALAGMVIGAILRGMVG